MKEPSRPDDHCGKLRRPSFRGRGIARLLATAAVVLCQSCQKEKSVTGPPYYSRQYAMPNGTNVHLRVTYRQGFRSNAEGSSPTITTNTVERQVHLTPDRNAEQPERYVGTLEFYQEFEDSAKILILGQCYYSPEREELALDIPHALYSVPDQAFAIYRDRLFQATGSSNTAVTAAMIRLTGAPYKCLQQVRSADEMDQAATLQYAYGYDRQEERLRRQDLWLLDEDSGLIAVDIASEGLMPNVHTWRGMQVLPATLGLTRFRLTATQPMNTSE